MLVASRYSWAVNSFASPTSALTVVLVLVGGLALVRLGLLASRATLRQVLVAGLTRAE